MLSFDISKFLYFYVFFKYTLLYAGFGTFESTVSKTSKLAALVSYLFPIFYRCKFFIPQERARPDSDS